jgi:plastocyanin
MKRAYLFSIAIVPALLLSACSTHLGLSRLLGGGSSSSAAGSPAVKPTRTPSADATSVLMANGHYRPKNLTVKAGTTLTWTNNDSTPQSVTSDAPGVFDSGPINPGATFAYTFAQAGVFPYHSTSASAVYGSVTVTP